MYDDFVVFLPLYMQSSCFCLFQVTYSLHLPSFPFVQIHDNIQMFFFRNDFRTLFFCRLFSLLHFIHFRPLHFYHIRPLHLQITTSLFSFELFTFSFINKHQYLSNLRDLIKIFWHSRKTKMFT